MEASTSHMRENDEDQALKGLLNAFGSMFTPREIAFAYRQASKNSELTGAILYDMQDRTSTSVSDEVKCGASSVSSNDEISEKSVHAGGNSTATKQNRFPASMGTVSSVLGKDYERSTPMTNRSSVTTKPLKLDLKEFPMVEIWEDEAKANSAKAISLPKDTEDFLFKMLGDGFQIDRDAIQEVLVHNINQGNGAKCTSKFSLLNSPVRTLQYTNFGAKLSVGFECGRVAVLDICSLSALFLIDCLSGSSSPVISLTVKSFLNANSIISSPEESEPKRLNDRGEEGSSEIDQLGKIFQAFGTPKPAQWPDIILQLAFSLRSLSLDQEGLI